MCRTDAMIFLVCLLKLSSLVFLATKGVFAWRAGIDRVRCRKYYNPASNPSSSWRGRIPSCFCDNIRGSCSSIHVAVDNGMDEQVTGEGHNHNSGKSNRHLLEERISTSRTELKSFIERMIVYFESMIDPATNQFFLFSYPQTPSEAQSLSVATRESRSHAHCPLRDLGSVWDATKALQVLRYYYGENAERVPGTTTNNSHSLKDAILQTTRKYSSSLVSTTDCDRNTLYLSPDVLGEPANIAHNALLLLSMIGSEELGLFGNRVDDEADRVAAMEGLTRGILLLQRPDGAFRTQFSQANDNNTNINNDDVYRGIEFFPGEAMTALMEVYLHSDRVPTRQRPVLIQEDIVHQILPAITRALGFYRAYYEECRKQNTVDANYSIWQIQAFARLVLALRELPQQQPQHYQSDFETIESSKSAVNEAAAYCLDMCRDIRRSPAWKLLSRGKPFYPNLSTVEIACGLDALCQGAQVLEGHPQPGHGCCYGDSDERMHSDLELSSITRHINEALDFLRWSQDRVPTDVGVGYGGLGHGGYCVTEQRLDVTGHALGAVSNLVVPK